MSKDQHKVRANDLFALVGKGAVAMLVFWIGCAIFIRSAEEMAPGVSQIVQILLNIGTVLLVGMIVLIVYHSIKAEGSDTVADADAVIRQRKRDIEDSV